MQIPPLHILLLGEPFSGKSTFNRTMPTPNLVFFFDPIGKDEAYLECGFVQTEDQDKPLLTPQGCPMKRVWKDEAMGELLFQVEYYYDSSWQESSDGGIEPIPTAYANFCKRLVAIDQEFNYWNTISLDSYSGIQLSVVLWHKYKLNPKATTKLLAWSGATNAELQMIIFSRLGMFPTNIVVIMHEGFYEDKGGTVYRAPNTYGGLGYEMPRGFSEMYRMVREPVSNRRYLQTQKDAMWNANSKYAPNPCEPNYQAIVASISKGE